MKWMKWEPSEADGSIPEAVRNAYFPGLTLTNLD